MIVNFKKPTQKPLKSKVKNRDLWNKAENIEFIMNQYFLDNVAQFESEPESTRDNIWNALNCLRRFKESLTIK